MKLATYKDGSRDGQLVVVSRDLTQAHFATGIATRLQQVLDDWNYLSPQLDDLYRSLNHGKPRHAFAFEPAKCLAPLPRAGRWVRTTADSNGEPALQDGASDQLFGPCDDVPLPTTLAPDLEAGVAVITGDLRAGSVPEQALEAVRLLVLSHELALRQTGDRPAAAFSPVAATPDELGSAWTGGRVQLPLHATWNGQDVPLREAGDSAHFGELLARLARWRHLRAGCIVGAARGRSDAASTSPLQPDDRWRIEMKDGDGHSLFGAIDHHLVAAV
jgi:fumarylacetoacetate (FAA) hydrolase